MPRHENCVVFLLRAYVVLVSILSVRISSPRDTKCDDEQPISPARLGDGGRRLGGQAKCRHSVLEVFSRSFLL